MQKFTAPSWLSHDSRCETPSHCSLIPGGYPSTENSKACKFTLTSSQEKLLASTTLCTGNHFQLAFTHEILQSLLGNKQCDLGSDNNLSKAAINVFSMTTCLKIPTMNWNSWTAQARVLGTFYTKSKSYSSVLKKRKCLRFWFKYGQHAWRRAIWVGSDRSHLKGITMSRGFQKFPNKCLRPRKSLLNTLGPRHSEGRANIRRDKKVDKYFTLTQGET